MIKEKKIYACNGLASMASFKPCSVEVDLTRVQLNVFLVIEDAVDDGLQHLVQIQHANGLGERNKGETK